MSPHSRLVVFRPGAAFDRRLLQVAAFLAGWIGLAGLAAAQSPATQWHRWELPLQSTRDYHQILVNGEASFEEPPSHSCRHRRR